MTGRLETRKKSVENKQEQGRGVMAQGPTNPTFSQGSGLVTYLNSVCIAQPSNLMHLRHCGNTEHVTDLQLLRTSIIRSEFGGYCHIKKSQIEFEPTNNKSDQKMRQPVHACSGV